MKSSNRQRTLLRQAVAFVFGLVLLLLAANEGAAQATNVLENTGNAGIGTLSPTSPLHIVTQTVPVQDIYVYGTSPLFRFQRAGGTIASPTGVVANDVLFAFNGRGYHSNGAFAAASASIRAVAAETFTGTATGASIYFQTTALGSTTLTNRMMIDPAGNLAIGNVSPYSRLVTMGVSGEPTLTHGTPAIASFLGASGGNELVIGASSSSPYAIWLQNRNFYSDGGAYPISLNPAGGNVGIGIAAPSYKLDVAGEIRSSSGGFRFPNNTVQTTAATMTGVTAGAGLTGGASSGTATVDIGQGTGITVAADAISVNYGSGAGTAVQGNTSVTITTDGSSGLSGGTSAALGSGPSFTLANTDKGSSQNIFKNVANAAGTTQFSAESNTDSLRFEGAGGTTVSFIGGSTKKVTIDSSGITSSQWTAAGTNNINYSPTGNVGIGIPTGSSPSEKLHVVGNGKITGNLTVDGTINAKYQDVAEWVPSSEQLSAGTVVVLDQTKSNQVISSTISYDTRVAGVISEQPGITLGESGEGKVLVATTGRVRVKVDASRGSIQIGDLLVTSDVSGLAMKSVPVNLSGVQLHRPGTIVGKALEPLASGKGEILVLLSLQ